jgi:hypothetical protein
MTNGRVALRPRGLRDGDDSGQNDEACKRGRRRRVEDEGSTLSGMPRAGKADRKKMLPKNA